MHVKGIGVNEGKRWDGQEAWFWSIMSLIKSCYYLKFTPIKSTPLYEIL